MQQLTIEHKKVKSNNQKVVSNEETIVEQENRREGHGWNIALTRHVYRLTNSDMFYCESEKVNDQYYFIRYESCFQYCSCLDNSMRSIKCKHIFAVEYSIRKNKLKDIEHLPAEAKRYPTIVTKDWRSDEYDF
jgi:predicted nucleic acid-binding Zn finger protein